MATITIYPKEPCLIPVSYESNPLTPYNKDYADILDVVMCFKKEPKEAVDKYVVKYLKDGTGTGVESGQVVVDEVNNKFTMVKLESDDVPVEKKGYKMVVGVLVTGLTEYIWLRVKDNQKIIVEEDEVEI
jgi:uncharacterized protein (UPF0248 family)